MQIVIDLRKYGVTKVVNGNCVSCIDTSKIDNGILQFVVDGEKISVKFDDKSEMVHVFGMITNGQVNL